MRRMATTLAILAAGCASPAIPESGDAMAFHAVRLQEVPEDGEALRALVIQMIESDAEVMASMRRHHGTGDRVMRHYYPSHRWAHPFIRGCILAQQGREEGAREEFWSALAEASEYVTTRACFGDGELLQVAEVVVQQSRRFLAAAP